jgi:polygalacturonase
LEFVCALVPDHWNLFNQVSKVLYFICATLLVAFTLSCSRPSSDSGDRKIYDVTEFGAVGDSSTINTAAIQKAIDQCFAEGGGTVRIPKGTFSSGALFLKSNVTLEVTKDAHLRAIAGLENYPSLSDTRIAGIEMTWPCAFINAIEAKNIMIAGEGTIDGSGYYWWSDYWKKRDSLSATVAPDLIDWHVPRPRLILFHKTEDSGLQGVQLRNSGFWTVHICYSKEIDVSDVNIYNPVLPEGHKAASSDGIDVDSSHDIVIRNCVIAVDDDCIAVKSGRGSDGKRVNIPTENVLIESCTFGTGHGAVSIGTETAGGIRNVFVRDCVAKGNKAPIKFKPRPGRGGVIENIVHDGWKIEQAGTVIDYSLREVTGEDYIDEWQKIKVPFNEATPRYRNITIRNVHATHAEKSISFLAWPLAHAENLILEDVHIEAEKGAQFQYVDNLLLKDVTIKVEGEGVPLVFKEVMNKVVN